MTGVQIFVGLFALASVVASAVAVWRVLKAPHLRRKPLWFLGCLCGFVGFGLHPGASGDLMMEVGVQIPVLIVRWSTAGEIVMVKALFPFIAIAALARSRAPRMKEAAPRVARAQQPD